MGIRRKSREAALQFLFQDDFSVTVTLLTDDVKERFERFCGLYQVNKKAREYSLNLLKQTIEHRVDIDQMIRQCATNWRLERIAVTDRNILRIAVSEMIYSEDVPHQVAMNEAVEIAKRYGTIESPSFINGVLDAVHSNVKE